MGFLNPSIYSIGQTATYASAFHDIRTGNNTNPASPTAFYAVRGYDLCTGWGTPTGKDLINALAPPPSLPMLLPAGATLALETCNPTNGTSDPGEAVIMRFTLQNFGGVSTTNLIATLLDTGEISPLSAPQSYGGLAQNATASRQFTFIPNGACGASANGQFQLQDGTADLSIVTFPVVLGALKNSLAENFDSITTPELPAGVASRPLPGPAGRHALRRLRAVIRRAVTALMAGRAPGRRDLAAVNRCLADAPFTRRVSANGGRFAVELVARADGIAHVLGEVAASFAQLLATGDPTRIKVCANRDCGWIVYDESRHRSRRWVESACCGNLIKVRRYRQRQPRRASRTRR